MKSIPSQVPFLDLLISEFVCHSLSVSTFSLDGMMKWFYCFADMIAPVVGACRWELVATLLQSSVFGVHVVHLGLVKREQVLHSTSNLSGIKLCAQKKSKV